MKTTFCSTLLSVLAASAFLTGCQKATPSVCFRFDKTEVVIATNASKSVRFAALEATNFLAHVFGRTIPIVNAPSGNGVSSLVLGENDWAKNARVWYDEAVRDAFTIVAKGDRVYIVGRDDPTADPLTLYRNGHHWNVRHERATLFGVYEFFERYAGCRFFFPGEMGTILPRATQFLVPEGTQRFAPYFTSRNPYMGGNGLWYEGDHKDPKAPCPGKYLHWLRLRCETENAPCCHGSSEFRYIERFAKTHPECLALKKDGKTRWDNPNVFAAYQYCWTNPFLRETMYEDIKAYLTGKKASTRGLKWWGSHCRGKFVDIMPEDSFQGCYCPTCQAAYDKTKKHYANGLIWGLTADLARRLKKDGIDGTLTQMSYLPYGEVPSFDLPENVLVIVAQGGPWCARSPEKVEQQAALYKAWQEKTHRRVQTWTYPHKFGATAVPGIPDVAPRAFGTYWKRVAPHVCGGFLETESDYAIYNYLNYYVFSKIAWDPKVNVEALLADHDRKMFGKGAEAMGRFFRILEDKWIGDMVGNIQQTAVGPVAHVPGLQEIWTKVYSPAVLKELSDCCARAIAAVGAVSDEARRVEFMRKNFLGPLGAESARYLDLISVEKEQARRKAAGPVVNLVPEGDFSKARNERGDLANWSGAKFDSTTFVSSPGSARVTHTNRLYAIRYFQNNELKPKTRYRLSYFLKLENVKKLGKPDTGVHMAFYDGMKELRYPSTSALDGTFDWVHQSFEFTTGDNAEKLKNGLICLRLMDASGTAWIDDVQVTEVKKDTL